MDRQSLWNLDCHLPLLTIPIAPRTPPILARRMPLTPELAAPSREQQTAGTAEMLARREPGTAVPHGSASSHTQPVAGDPMPGTSSSHKTPRHTTHNTLVHRDFALGVADPGAGATPITPGVSAAIAVGAVLFVLVLAVFGLRNTGKSWKGRNGSSSSNTDEEAAREQQQHCRGGKDSDADARRRRRTTTHTAPRPTTRMQTPPYVEQPPPPPPVSHPEPAAHRRPRLARNTSPFTAEMQERRQAPQQRRGREAAGLHVAAGAGTVGDHGPELRHPTPISPVGVSGGDMSALLGTAGGGGGPILPPVLTPGWCPTPTPPPPAGAGGAPSSSSSYLAARRRPLSAVGVQQGQISHDIAPFQAQEDVPSGGQHLRERERERERERLEELMRRQGEVRAAGGREGQ
ncbi:hypothetical protein GGTG_07692 [Gaeumannomyces tritici R3-111a-1]|uniref:Uncharacterized protein n=1 Tax=Gaeumannomyces tritici (strain R3-111a-1) TaxID=644352 RepID=J3P2E5_GAET3|nr:hypothetical protein GGTG_07692 [Gaeumannomyces tritici R3-111a-1]EJT73837.1 hypothetical protein GGTG_07692 [Gaeumannomyces tritici R3-111a-1]